MKNCLSILTGVLFSLVIVIFIAPLPAFAGGKTTVAYTPDAFNFSVDQFGNFGATGGEKFSVRVSHSDPPSGPFASCEKAMKISLYSKPNINGPRQWLEGKHLQPPVCTFEDTLSAALAHETLKEIKSYCAFSPGKKGTISRVLEVAIQYRTNNIDLIHNNANINVTCLPVCPPVTFITNETLPVATLGASYTAAIQTAGGEDPTGKRRSYHLKGGSFPPGLSLSESGGKVTGTASVAGRYAFQVEVRDACGFGGQQVASKAFFIEVPPEKKTELEGMAGMPGKPMRRNVVAQKTAKPANACQQYCPQGFVATSCYDGQIYTCERMKPVNPCPQGYQVVWGQCPGNQDEPCSFQCLAQNPARPACRSSSFTVTPCKVTCDPEIN